MTRGINWRRKCITQSILKGKTGGQFSVRYCPYFKTSAPRFVEKSFPKLRDLLTRLRSPLRVPCEIGASWTARGKQTLTFTADAGFVCISRKNRCRVEGKGYWDAMYRKGLAFLPEGDYEKYCQRKPGINLPTSRRNLPLLPCRWRRQVHPKRC